jgi:hypothetical protein
VQETRTLRELIDALVILVTHSGGGTLSGPNYSRLIELDTQIGSECQLRGIQIPRLGESHVHGQSFFGFTRVPYFELLAGGIATLPGTNWQQGMRGLKVMADQTEPKPPPAVPVEPVTPNIRADRSPLFPKGVPDGSDLVDLVTRLDAERDSGKSWNEIARVLLGESKESDPRSRSLLRQIRRMRSDGRVNL